jgi:hypothetical protein
VRIRAIRVKPLNFLEFWLLNLKRQEAARQRRPTGGRICGLNIADVSSTRWYDE